LRCGRDFATWIFKQKSGAKTLKRRSCGTGWRISPDRWHLSNHDGKQIADCRAGFGFGFGDFDSKRPLDGENGLDILEVNKLDFRHAEHSNNHATARIIPQKRRSRQQNEQALRGTQRLDANPSRQPLEA
jgi:hypothetical protein